MHHIFQTARRKELQTWYTDRGRRPASSTGAMTDLQGQGHTRPINADTHRVPYLLNGKAYKLQTRYTGGGQRPASSTGAKVIPGPLMLTHIVRHIFWTASRSTNFKLGIQMEDDDPRQPQTPWPPRSKSQGHVISLSRQGHTVLAEPGGDTSCFTVCTFDIDIAQALY